MLHSKTSKKNSQKVSQCHVSCKVRETETSQCLFSITLTWSRIMSIEVNSLVLIICHSKSLLTESLSFFVLLCWFHFTLHRMIWLPLALENVVYIRHIFLLHSGRKIWHRQIADNFSVFKNASSCQKWSER